ncbi:MAG TPA: hypothetical protein EYN91_15845 [Candidatus Melainabacteria bacterium]|nr:hypothetical protein [Candidatus Melainabacteria bacterium]HIN66185.1 hypothetical protein [Candidatus Obscuribacterales bacterium]
MENSPFEVPVQDVLSDGYLNPDDAILSVPDFFPTDEAQEGIYSADPKNFAGLLPMLDLDGNTYLNKAELKAATFNDSLSELQLSMVDWLGTRYDLVKVLGPTDVILDNSEISAGDLDELNNVASGKYGLKNLLSTMLQETGNGQGGYLFASLSAIACGLAMRSPLLISFGSGGLVGSALLGGGRTVMNSAENRAMESELQTLFANK